MKIKIITFLMLLGFSAVAATNIVPRAANYGDLGTQIKPYRNVFSGGTWLTNTANGSWILETNGIITLGASNSASTITLSGPAGIASATTFSGSGSGLTSLQAANVTGTLPQTTYPVALTNNQSSAVTFGSTITGNGSGITNVDAASTNKVHSGPTFTGDVTNTATAAFWNSAHTHYMTNNANGWSVDGGAASGNEFEVTGDIKASGNITTVSSFTGGNVYSGSTTDLGWSSRTTMTSPADGSLRVAHFTVGVGDRIYMNGPAKALTDASTTGIFTLASRTNSFVGGVIDYTIFCQDSGLESQSLSGLVTFAAVNTNGVWTTPVLTEVSGNQAKCVTSGTLTTTWSGAAASSGGTTNLTISVNADTSITPAANKFFIRWFLRNSGTNVVTAL